jgi:hypothetical protein
MMRVRGVGLQKRLSALDHPFFTPVVYGIDESLGRTQAGCSGSAFSAGLQLCLVTGAAWNGGSIRGGVAAGG